MVIVISYTFMKNEYDYRGNMIHKKGDTIVSHGVDTITDKIVTLPEENWSSFTRDYCYYDSNSGEYYLK